jgi:hypothetical protein
LATCLKCEQELSGDFGMVPCPNCGELNFLDDTPDKAEARAVAKESMDVTFPPRPVPTNPDKTVPIRRLDTPAVRSKDTTEHRSLSSDLDEITHAKPIVDTLDALAESPLLGTSNEYDMNQGVASQNPEEPNLEEIVDFANDISSSAPDGFLHYDVTVSGIDSKEIRKDVLSALTDRKFGWNSEDLVKRMKNGTLFFPDLSPIKASQIVKKLRYIDVQVSWTQKPLHLSP